MGDESLIPCSWVRTCSCWRSPTALWISQLLFSLAIWLSPFFQWFGDAADGLDASRDGDAARSAPFSIRCERRRRLVGWAGWRWLRYAAIGFVLLFLHPPFQIPTALVLVVVGVCYVVARWS